jgi:L,D-transpeptidase catalytic domain/Bacterial Ig-like domain
VFKLGPPPLDEPAAPDEPVTANETELPGAEVAGAAVAEPAAAADYAPPTDTGSTSWSADLLHSSWSGADSLRRAEPLDSTRPMTAAAAQAEAGPVGDPGPAPDAGSEQAPASYGAQAAEPSSAGWSAASLGISAAAAGGGGAGGSGSSGGWSGSGGSGGSGGSAEPAGAGGQRSRRRVVSLVGIAAALVVVIGAGGVYYFSNASKASQSSADKKPVHKVSAPVKGPEQLVSVTPADGATQVNGGAAIKVVFSKPLSPSSPMPTLKPAIDGNWSVSGDAATFVPTAGFWQRTKVKVTIPAGASGVVSTAGGKLGTAVTDSFTTGTFSMVRLEQLLAQLGYLPLTWAPATGSPAALTDLNAQYAAAYEPPPGTYTWQSGYPTELASLWKPDAPSQILRGAVAAFQADHGLMDDMIAENQDGLIVTGDIGYRLWKAMFKALANDDLNKHGYSYAIANQHYPEMLTVWHNGKQIFRHLANTGIPVSPTSVGTNPVYIRYVSQIMKGTNPDGSKYADQVYWVSYFHDGEAVHYFPRYSYGSQQSLGCVELPYDPAKWIWPYLTYGTLVTVTPT